MTGGNFCELAELKPRPIFDCAMLTCFMVAAWGVDDTLRATSMEDLLVARSDAEFKFKLTPACFLLEVAALVSSAWLRPLSVGFVCFACALPEL